MSAEIKILIESYSESESLKATNTQLKDMLKTLQDIGKTRADKAKSVSVVSDYTKEVAALKQLQIENEKYKQSLDKTTAAEVKLLQEKQKLTQQEEKSAQAKSKTALEALKLSDAEKKSADAAQRATEKSKRQNDSYGLLSKRHAELKREALNLAAAYGVESKQATAAAQAANKLDVQLKAIDAKMGDHRRNVGNYASAFQGLNNVLGQFGIALSVGAVFQGLKSSIHAFVEAEKNAHALEFAVKNVGNEGEIAFNKLIKQSEELQANGGVFSDDEIQQAQTQLVNYGLLSDEVEELMPKILDLATAQGVDLATATDTVIKGINGQTKGLKTVGLGFENTGTAAGNYAIILNGLTKFEGAAAAAATTTEGKYKVLMNRFDDMKEDIGEFLINEGAKYLDYWDVLTGKLSAVELAQKGIQENTSKAFDPFIDKILEHVDTLDTEAEKTVFLNNKMIILLQTIKNLNAERRAANAAGDTSLVAGTTAQIAGVQEQLDRLMAAKHEIQNANKQSIDERVHLEEEGVKKETTNYVDEWEKALLEVDKFRDDAYANEAARAQKRIEIEEKLRALELQTASDNAKETARYLDKLEELDALAAEAKENGVFNQERYNQDLEAIEKEHFDNLEELKDSADQKEIDAEKKKKDELDKVRKEEFNQAISHYEHLGEKIFDELQKQSERRQEILEDEIKEQDDAVSLQRDRAAKGLSNTLAFEEREKAKLQRQLIEEQKKQERLKKQEAYWSLLAAFAKSDSDQAAQKAALEIAEGIAISAAFREKGGMGSDVTETTVLKNGEWSKTHGSGDILTMISPNEGILTEQNIAALGGREGFYDLKYNLEQMGNNPISDDIFAKQNESFVNVGLTKVATMNTKPIEEKLDRVVDAISKIEVHRHEVDKWGNYLLTVQKQNSRITTDKGRFVNPRRSKWIN